MVSLCGVFPASAASDLSAEEQLQILKNNVGRWNLSDAYTPYNYAVTDLDGNGYLEIFAAVTQGSGMFTSGTIFEVMPDRSLRERPLVWQEGTFIPEVIVNSAEVYTDPIRRINYYIFSDTVRIGAADSCTTVYGFSLYKGRTLLDRICGENRSGYNGNVFRNFFGADDAEISEAQYNTAVSEFYSGYSRSEAKFGWFPMSGGDLLAILRNSFSTFSGIEETPDIPVGSNGNIVITKNPTAESLAIGGKNWFIAHATGADTVTWQLIDSMNRVYSLSSAMAANPGLKTAVQNRDTLEISNVPASLNGWFARAVFSNSQYSAATQPAAIYVGDFVSLYGNVINAYKSAYQFGKPVSWQAFQDFGISEWSGYCDHVGYGMKDLNKDGTPELIIAAMNAARSDEMVVLDVYTLDNKTPVCLGTSRVRDRRFLRADSSILREGSNGAAYAYYSISKLRNGALVELESVRSDLDANGNAVWYFKSENSRENQVSEAYAQAKIKAYEDTIFLPYLTKIA